VKGENSIPKINFNTTIITIDTTFSYMQIVLALLTISNRNKDRIEILVTELDRDHQNENKILKEFKEYEKTKMSHN
jgi:hypothetical protein